MTLPLSTPKTSVVKVFCAALDKLAGVDLTKFDRLHFVEALNSSEVQGKVRDWYKKQGVLKGKKLQDVSKATAKRFAIFQTNSTVMDTTTRGLFAINTRMNHSCSPNTVSHYKPGLGCLTVHASHDIKDGEQLFTTYIDGACCNRAQRHDQLRHWGFHCECHACTDTATDQLRSRMHELEQGLEIYGHSNAPFVGRFIPVPQNLGEALAFAEELKWAMDTQGMYGPKLSKV